RLRGQVVRQAKRRLPFLPPELRIVRLDLLLDARVRRRIPRGNGVIRRALEHREMRCLLRDHWDDLDTGRAGPDDADAPAAEIDCFMWPCAGEIRLALECVQPLVWRYVSCAEEAGGRDEESGLHTPVLVCTAVVCPNSPDAACLVIRRRNHPSVE